MSASRLQPVLDALGRLADPVRLVASGRQSALDALTWPPGARLLAHAGWQSADIALASAYSPDDQPLLLATGDGDFGLLASRHAGAVLVISSAPSGRLRDVGTVLDPAVDGIAPVTSWLAAVGIA